jgi:ribonuclease HI
MKVKCYFDGACEPKNPGGNMGTGAYVLINDKEVYTHSNFYPANDWNTNNVAEYLALHEILLYLRSAELHAKEIWIHGDSNLVIQQMSGKWKIKNGFYKDAARECVTIIKELQTKYVLNFKWIPRELNGRADKLSKQHLLSETTH